MDEMGKAWIKNARDQLGRLCNRILRIMKASSEVDLWMALEKLVKKSVHI
jgi:hypothetical protein